MSLLPGILLPRIRFIDWLLQRKETVHLYMIPYTDEQKAAIKAQQDKYDEETRASGLAYEERLTFPVQGKFLFEVLPCTQYGRKSGQFTYFLYDCTDSEMSSIEGDFVDLNTLSSQEKAIEAGYKHAELLLFLLED